MTVQQSRGVCILRVGWFRRDESDPDEYIVHWVTPYRKNYDRLAEIWVKGPKHARDFSWSPVVEAVCHRMHFQPLAKLDPELWKSVVGECPWKD